MKNTKFIATIVIIAMLAGFVSVVAQISQQASATATFCPPNGAKQQGAQVCKNDNCKIIVTPSGQSNTKFK